MFDSTIDPIDLRPCTVSEAEFAFLVMQAHLSAELAALRSPQPTTALLDGTARRQRERREERRRLDAAVRVLHVDATRPVSAESEQEAA